jgi:YVTN family beta-propeller protein
MVRVVIGHALRFAAVAALAVAAVVVSPAASADSTLPAYNVTQPTGVPNARTIAVDPTSHRVYVGSFGDSVFVLDGLTGSTIATIPLAYVPTSVAIDPSTNRLFVFGLFTSFKTFGRAYYLTIVDTATSAIISTLTEPYPLPPLVVDPIKHHVLALPIVLDETGRQFSLTPGQESFVSDDAFAFDPTLQRAYVMTSSTGTVTVYNTATYSVIATVKVSATPTSIALDPTTHQVYVSDLNHGVVSVINATTNTLSTTIPVGGTPTSIAIDSAAGLVYVANLQNTGTSGPPFPDGNVTVIDATHNTVLYSVTVAGVAGNGNGLAVDTVTHTAWLAGNQLTELDPVVSRRSGTDRFGTATAISGAAYDTQGADAVVLARSDTYPDALVGAPFAASKNAPLLYTSGAAMPASTAAEITRVLAPGKTVYLLGGVSAIPASIATQLTGMGYVVSRVSGADRYATAVAVADAMGDPSTVFLATAANYADALAAGPAAAHATGAILLTDDTTMPTATTAYLAAHPGTTYAVGGPAATADPSASAISGTDRYATAALVAQQFFATPTVVGLASGTTFADALPAAAYMARVGGPLLLTDPHAFPPDASQYLPAAQSGVTHGLVFGGTTAVSVLAATEFSAALGR